MFSVFSVCHVFKVSSDLSGCMPMLVCELHLLKSCFHISNNGLKCFLKSVWGLSMQFAYMHIQVHIEDNMVELVGTVDNSSPGGYYVHSSNFKVVAKHLGITTLYVSSLSLLLPISYYLFPN